MSCPTSLEACETKAEERNEIWNTLDEEIIQDSEEFMFTIKELYKVKG